MENRILLLVLCVLVSVSIFTDHMPENITCKYEFPELELNMK